MTALLPHPVGIPAPEPTTVSQPFWDGCRRGELRYQRCVNGHPVFVPGVICRSCLTDDLRWEMSAGFGEIYAWSTVWRPQVPSFRVPYTVAIVGLDEGFSVVANVIGCDHEEVCVGLCVRAEFHSINSEISLLYFTPVTTT